MFKHMSDTSLQVLLNLYNSIWNPEVLPPSWSHSLVVPIPKPSKPSYLPSSCRPISLTSNACKLLKRWYITTFWTLNSQDSENGDKLLTTSYASMMPCKTLSQQTSPPSNLWFGKSLRHGQPKRSPFENSKTWYQWQYVQFYSSISL